MFGSDEGGFCIKLLEGFTCGKVEDRGGYQKRRQRCEDAKGSEIVLNWGGALSEYDNALAIEKDSGRVKDGEKDIGSGELPNGYFHRKNTGAHESASVLIKTSKGLASCYYNVLPAEGEKYFNACKSMVSK